MVPKDRIMLLSDIKTEADIPRLEAIEFKKYGQSLDNFPRLFTLGSESARRVVNKFVSVYHESIPTADYDAALPGIAESGKLALLAYITPKASEQARADLFVKGDNLKVLSILFAGVTHERGDRIHLLIVRCKDSRLGILDESYNLIGISTPREPKSLALAPGFNKGVNPSYSFHTSLTLFDIKSLVSVPVSFNRASPQCVESRCSTSHSASPPHILYRTGSSS